MRVLVTGGAGFIGANLVRRLEERAHDVRVVDDLSSGARSNLDGTRASFRRGSVADAAFMTEAARGSQAVVHLAAVPSVPRSVEDPVRSHTANATGTLTVLEAARAAGDVHVVVASSSSVYGANPQLPKREDMRPVPLSPYAVSKLATETYALSHQHVYGLPTLAFRFFNVYGPLQTAGHAYAAVIPAFVEAALAGRPATVHGDGGQTRDFTMVDTVTAVLADAVERRVRHPEPVNLAFGSRTSLVGLLDTLADVLGAPVARDHVAVRAGDVRDSQADRTTLEHLFPGVEPVDLRTGLERTVAWFRSLGT